MNEFAIVSALIKYIIIISLMNPGAAGNALQKKKPDIIRLGLIEPPPRNLHRIVSIVNRSVKPNTRIDTQHPHFLIC